MKNIVTKISVKCLLTVMVKQEVLLQSSAMYPPRLQPGQQSAGPFVSQSSVQRETDLRWRVSREHIEIMDLQLKRVDPSVDWQTTWEKSATEIGKFTPQIQLREINLSCWLCLVFIANKNKRNILSEYFFKKYQIVLQLFLDTIN